MPQPGLEDTLGLMANPKPAVGTAHVLVVDDDPGIRGFILMTLRAEGYSVTAAANGHQALECVADRMPDVVLLDLSMPLMNGWQFQQCLRDLSIDVPLVFMTAGYSARTEAERHGAAGYLAKPFEVEDLLDTVARFAKQ